MGAIISVIGYYISRQVEKPRKTKQGVMGFIFSIIRCFICRQEEKLRKMKQGLMRFILSIIRCFICRPVEEPRKIKEDEPSLEDIQYKEPQMVLIEKAEKREDESSNLQQQEVLISSASFNYSMDSETFVDNSVVVEAKTRDECLAEQLNSGVPIEKKRETCLVEVEEPYYMEPIEKRKDVCLPEDLHSEEPIEDVEEKEAEVTKGVVSEERWINHYSSSQKILLVGEGDFSFSASLAEAIGSASNMIATSLDSREFLEKNYRRAIYNIIYLTSKGCRVIHEVNAKKMANNPLLKGMAFDCVIYNFPFAGFFKTESREFQLRQHRKLVSQFLKNAKEMMDEEGEIHVTHKTNAFHCEWNIEQLASCHGLKLIEASSFDYKNYAGYRPKCGFGGDEDFDCKPCKTYKFGLRTASTEKKKKGKKTSRRAASNPGLATEPK